MTNKRRHLDNNGTTDYDYEKYYNDYGGYLPEQNNS